MGDKKEFSTVDEAITARLKEMNHEPEFQEAVVELRQTLEEQFFWIILSVSLFSYNKVDWGNYAVGLLDKFLYSGMHNERGWIKELKLHLQGNSICSNIFIDFNYDDVFYSILTYLKCDPYYHNWRCGGGTVWTSLKASKMTSR